jgi:hypothetical protein
MLVEPGRLETDPSRNGGPDSGPRISRYVGERLTHRANDAAGNARCIEGA